MIYIITWSIQHELILDFVPSLKGGKGLDTRQKEWLEGGKGKGGDLRRREKYEKEEEKQKEEKHEQQEEKQKVKKTDELGGEN